MVCVTMCSLVMSLFSPETEILIKYFNLLTSVQYLHSAWFLDGRTSLVSYQLSDHFVYQFSSRSHKCGNWWAVTSLLVIKFLGCQLVA